MIRVLLYILAVAVLGSGFAWLASNPGDVVLTFGDMRYTTSVLVLISAALVALVVLWLVLWLVRIVFTSPSALMRRYHYHREEKGREALSQGLIAVLAGDVASARRLNKKVDRLLSDDREPLTLYLEAQTYLLDQDYASAIAVYERLRQHEKTKLLGLSGLYHEAVKSGAFDAANQYAQEAILISPGVKWANRAVIDRMGVEGEWQQAVQLFDRMEKAMPRIQRGSDKLSRRRAVLLTGQAMDIFENNPNEACQAALKAHKLAADFIPAANVAADILFRLQELRKGSKLIEAMWKKYPHPDLGATYVNAVSGQSSVERLKRAQTLAKANPTHFESLMLVARQALETGEFALAQECAEKAVKNQPRESVFLLLADIEEASSGDQGRVRQWLQRAVRAERDPVWMADGLILENWAPVSPLSGRLDGVEWKVPTRHLGPVLDQDDLVIPEKPAVITEVVQSATKKKTVSRRSKNEEAQPKIVDEPPLVLDGVVDDSDISPQDTTRINVDDPGVGKSSR